MKFGYACINTSIKTGFRTCRLATVKKEGINKVKELTLLNLEQILKNLKWNLQKDIKFYRMTSNVVPFATHSIIKEDLKWEWHNDEQVLEITSKIKDLVNKHDIRLTVHPGQHSPLNTPNDNVLYNTFLDFDYHDKLLTLMGGSDMITHVGGMYGDKEVAKLRFVEHYDILWDSAKGKLRLENDDKVFNVEDVLDIHKMCGVPICLDIHHHNCNPCSRDIKELIPEIVDSWKGFGKPKTHISTGRLNRTDRAHHDYVFESDLLGFLDILNGNDVDIMFECKAKEQAVLKLLSYQK